MILNRTFTFALATLSLSSVALAGTGQVAIEANRDNTLFKYNTGHTSNGAGTNFIVGRTGPGGGSNVRRGIVGFDVAGSVPAGATITGASLQLYMRMTVSGPENIDAHRVVADWGEGTSFAATGTGAGSTSGDATWIHTFYPSKFWNTQGGDFVGTASASTSVDQVGYYSWSSAQMIADVQSMLDAPANDFGWILIGEEVATFSTKMFSSHEIILPAERPQLVIDYTTTPEVYCTAGTSSSGCQASVSATGIASASATSGFTVSVATVEGSKDGQFFYGSTGRQASAWGNGTSYMCVLPPRLRGGLLPSSGTNGSCDGSFSQDLNARWCPSCPKPSHNPGAGSTLQAQFWYRDPQSSSNQTTGLSDAVEVFVCP
jgi:hypothetical protein